MAVFRQFRTKPFEVYAHRFTGQNWLEMAEFCGRRWTGDTFIPIFGDSKDWIFDPAPDVTAAVYNTHHNTWVGVKAGQWIILGQDGEYYPCDPEVFEAKYEAVDE